MLDNEQLKELEEFASAYLTLNELEKIMGLPKGFLKQAMSEQLPEGLAVERGRLKHKAKLRIGVFNLAFAGSGPAQAMADNFIKECEILEV
jgi:hypothetical protein